MVTVKMIAVEMVMMALRGVVVMVVVLAMTIMIVVVMKVNTRQSVYLLQVVPTNIAVSFDFKEHCGFGLAPALGRSIKRRKTNSLLIIKNGNNPVRRHITTSMCTITCAFLS